MWTEITRPKYERKGVGYSSDLSDAEWLMIEPRLPQRNRLGRPPKTKMRSVVNALLYMVRTGCQWRQLPREFPPYTTVQHYFYAWRDGGVLQRDKLLNTLAKFGDWTVEIVRRMADTVGFEVLPRRWVVERTLAWLNRNRRLAKDFEATIASATAWLYLASVQLLIRRLARA